MASDALSGGIFNEGVFVEIVIIHEKCVDDYDKHKHYIAFHLRELLSTNTRENSDSDYFRLIRDKETLRKFLEIVINNYVVKYPVETEKCQNRLNFIRMMLGKPVAPEIVDKIRNLPVSQLRAIAEHFACNSNRGYFGWLDDSKPLASCTTERAYTIANYQELVDFYNDSNEECPSLDFAIEFFPLDKIEKLIKLEMRTQPKSEILFEVIEGVCEWDRHDVFLMLQDEQFDRFFDPIFWIDDAMICGRMNILRSIIEIEEIETETVKYSCYPFALSSFDSANGRSGSEPDEGKSETDESEESQHQISLKEFLTGNYFVVG